MWRLALVLAGCGRVFGLVELHDDAPAGDLVAWYPFEDNALDATSHGHDASCVMDQCPTPIAGHQGSAYMFDGLDDYLIVAGSDEFSTSAGTVAAWLMLTRPPSYVCPLNKLLGGQGDNSWQVCIDESLLIDFYAGGASLLTDVKFPIGEWHHLALRWNGSNKRVSLDGVEIKTGGMASLTFDGDAILFGGDKDNGALVGQFAGAIDEVRIYNRDLGNDEITLLFQQ